MYVFFLKNASFSSKLLLITLILHLSISLYAEHFCKQYVLINASFLCAYIRRFFILPSVIAGRHVYVYEVMVTKNL